MSEPEKADATVLILRDEQGTMQVAQTDDDVHLARENAKQRKAIFEHRVAGSTARAGKLPRRLTASLASGTVNLMLAKLLQEEILPASATEAAQVAKVAFDIYKQTAGLASGAQMTPAERADRLAEVDQLERELLARAKKVSAPLGGATPKGEEVPEVDDEWEHDSDSA